MKIDILLKKILNKITTGVVDSNNKISTETIQLDFSTKANIKHEYINDEQILVIHDVPIAKEMVQVYGDAKHYKPAEAVDKINVEYSPVAMWHPDHLFNEMTDAEKVDRIIGYTLGGYTKDNKKYADMYFFVSDKTKRIQDDVKEGNTIDVSIGFNVEYDFTPGEFNGTHYDVIQKKITLDHTAALPDATGRASLPDGVGIGADSNKNKEVHKTMDEKNLTDAYKQVGDLERELGDSKAKATDLQKQVDEQAKQIQTLKDESKKFDEYKEKATKFDAAKKKADEAEKEKCTDLKKEILKIRNDDGFKKFINKMDSKNLGFTLDELKSSGKALPGRKDKAAGTTTDEHPADVKFKERHKEKTGQVI